METQTETNKTKKEEIQNKISKIRNDLAYVWGAFLEQENVGEAMRVENAYFLVREIQKRIENKG